MPVSAFRCIAGYGFNAKIVAANNKNGDVVTLDRVYFCVGFTGQLIWFKDWYCPVRLVCDISCGVFNTQGFAGSFSFSQIAILMNVPL